MALKLIVISYLVYYIQLVLCTALAVSSTRPRVFARLMWSDMPDYVVYHERE